MTAPPALGSDVVELDRLAIAFRSAARTMAALSGTAVRLRRTGWSGPDADAVLRAVTAADRERRQVLESLERCAAWLDRAADRQRDASSDTPLATASSAAALSATVSAAPSRPPVTVQASTTADGGRLVQRVGSPDAPVLVLVVPGVGTDPGDRDRLRDDAVRLWRALTARADDPDAVAVVSWLGYDPPDVVVGALDPRPADEGARNLVREVAAALRAGARRVTVVGHSYGAVVAGRAAVRGMDADVLVQLGAPGVGAPGATSVIGRSGITHVAVREDDDPVGWVSTLAGPLYGEDPVGRVPSLPTSGNGHGAYFGDRVLLRALAGLAVGP